MVERAAARAVQQGDSVSVVVIRLAEAMFRPGLTQRLAAQIRAHLRAAEPAGALTEGEIAALLFDTGPDQARAVIARLRRIANTLDEGATLASATMGVAWRSGGTAYETPLVAAARENALERVAGSADSPRLQ
jgi:GGDEF domain-containing protein